jgi:hypothetical protein
MIFAGEARAIAMAVTCYRGAAMRTDVEEGAHLAGLVAVDQHRQAGGVHRLVIAGPGQFGGERQHQWQSLEDEVDLCPPLVGVEIGAHRHVHRLVGHEGVLVLDIIEHLLGGLTDRLHAVHQSLLRRSV